MYDNDVMDYIYENIGIKERELYSIRWRIWIFIRSWI
jgi:hypothetical protein